MIDLSQKIKTKWNSYTRLHYQNLGYSFTKIGDELIVELKDVPLSSHVKVTAICDYCGKEYYPVYKNYNNSHTKKEKDCCKACAHLSAKDTMLERYGAEHYQQTEECKERKTQTFLKKYGVENPSQVDSIQEKKKKTNLEKFGSEWYTSSQNFKETCIDKYNVTNPMQSTILQEKAINTLKNNGNVPVSSEERKLVKMIQVLYGEENCIPCYNFGRLVFDCLLKIKETKIDIEYDGAYWHKNRKQYDRGRDEVVKKEGYKVIRVLSNGKMPTEEQLKFAVEKVIKDCSFYCINLT